MLAGPHVITIAGRDLTIGDVYAMHPHAVAINGKDAIAALDAGEAEGFEIHYRPVDTPYFYLTLADALPDEVRTRPIALWSLYGVEQPGVPDDAPPSQSV